MAIPESLRTRARRAYELGRLRFAARAGFVLLPLTLGCALATGAHQACACLGVAALLGSVALRWHGRRGVNAALAGALAGAVPLAAALATAPALACLAVGALAGAWLGARGARTRESLAISAAAAALGAAVAGLGAVAAGPAGLVAGTALAAALSRGS